MTTQTAGKTPGTEVAITSPTALQAMFNAPDDDGLQALLKRIREEATGEVPDLTTAKGRDRVRSLAARVASSKTTIDKFGLGLTKGWREQTAIVNDRRKAASKFLDNLKVEVRAPLTEWEEAEEVRVEGHRATIQRIKDAASGLEDGSEGYAEAIAFVEGIDIGEAMEEFREEAEATKAATLATLRERHAAAKDREDRDAELEKLRAEAAARKVEDGRRAAERAEAERAAQAKADEERRADEAKEAAERQRIADEEAKAAAIEQAREDERAKAQRDAEASKAREEKAEAERVAAQERAERAEAEAKKAAADAVEAERAATARKKAEDEEAERARKQDAAHRKALVAESVEALTESGIDATMARQIVGLIVSGAVPHITMKF